MTDRAPGPRARPARRPIAAVRPGRGWPCHRPCTRPRAGRRRGAAQRGAPCRRSRPGAARRRNSSSTSTQPAQPFLQLSTGVVEAAHHRSLRTLEHLTDLLVGEPIHFSEEYYRSMFRGQLGDGSAELLGDLGVTRVLVGIALLAGIGQGAERILGGALAGSGFQAGLGKLGLAALVIDAEVHGDAVGPGVEAGVTLEAV